MLLKEYYPKGYDLGKVTQEELQVVVKDLNNRPRKKIGLQNSFGNMVFRIQGVSIGTTLSIIKWQISPRWACTQTALINRMLFPYLVTYVVFMNPCMVLRAVTIKFSLLKNFFHCTLSTDFLKKKFLLNDGGKFNSKF